MSLACLFALPFYLLDAELKLLLLYSEVIPDDLIPDHVYLGQLALLLMFVVQSSLYLAWCFRELSQHRKQIQNNFSYTDRIGLSWLRCLLGFITTLYILFLLDVFTSDWLGLDDQFNNALYLLMVVMFYTLGYLGLRQPDIFKPLKETQPPLYQELENRQIIPDNKALKYKTSSLDDKTTTLLLADLVSHMQTHKPHLESKITLPLLSAQLSISTNYLSQITNQQFNQNFFDFINHYRVREAKIHLANLEQEKINILNVGYGSGFNSKSAFYSAFKKHTGMTPTQYRKTFIAKILLKNSSE